MKEGSLFVGARLMGTSLNVTHEVWCPSIGPVCALRREPPQVHDQRFLVGELRAFAELAVRDWLSLELQLPVRVTATSIVFRRLDGTPFTPEYGDIHHRDETLVGLGDPWLQARLRTSLAGVSVAVSAGATLPVGRVEPNPFALGRAGLTHQHVQFGAGLVNPLVGFEASRQWARVTARASGLAQLSLGENLYGYQAGSRFLASVGVDVRVVDALSLGGTVDSITELPERWDGRVEQDGNVGRSDLLLGAQAVWRLGEAAVTLSVRVPVVQYFFDDGYDSQLRYPAIVALGVQRTFELLR
ncbi:MAG: hypothetical protein IAE78_00760 [Myxococcus sp.]|nr:hypothetical protein [Myxococcus sp.]